MAAISKSTINFLKKLKENNNKEWFDKNRKLYESAKQDFIEFVDAIIKGIQKFDSEVPDLIAKKTIFRINRDIRFSKDKSPYKSNMGTTISKGEKKMMSAGYYFHLEPGNKSFAAGGSYQPEKEKLEAIRQEIDYQLKDFKKILQASSFKKPFSDLSVVDQLKKAPKGYATDHPAIEYLKHKSFIVTQNFSDKEVTSSDFDKQLLQSFKAMHPLNQFINRAIDK